MRRFQVCIRQGCMHPLFFDALTQPSVAHMPPGTEYDIGSLRSRDVSGRWCDTHVGGVAPVDLFFFLLLILLCTVVVKIILRGFPARPPWAFPPRVSSWLRCMPIRFASSVLVSQVPMMQSARLAAAGVSGDPDNDDASTNELVKAISRSGK